MTYIETEVLILALGAYERAAKEKLREMLPGERRKLQEAINRLDDWIADVEIESAYSDE